MPIETIGSPQQNPPKPTKKILVYTLGILGVGLLVYFGGDLLRTVVELRGKSAVTVDSVNKKAEVYINGNYAGTTPYESTDLKPGQNTVTLKTETRQYETTLNFISNSDKYIHNVGIFRDIGTSDVFTSGQEFWFEQNNSGNVARIVSEPAGATVFIDNAEVGKTPYSSTTISEGSYDLRIEYPGYESQSTRFNVKEGYTLNISLKLFPLPTPSTVEEFAQSGGLYNIYSDKAEVVSDTQAWVNAVIYWNETRGINLAGQGVRKEKLFNYFVDYKGNLYNQDGILVAPDKISEMITSKERGAYLGRISDGDGLTPPAVTAVEALTGTAPAQTGSSVEILETGTGWLRVRSEPSLDGAEVGKATVGETYILLESGDEWMQIKLDETTSGWVSSTYVKVL